MSGGTTNAYRLVHLGAFDGQPTTYSEKTRNAEAARNDPNGFYHGMTVAHGGPSYVLCGPEIHLIPGQVDQSIYSGRAVFFASMRDTIFL